MLDSDGYPNAYSLIRRALVTEIKEAQRWTDIEEACDALLHVRLIANSMKREHDLMRPTYE